MHYHQHMFLWEYTHAKVKSINYYQQAEKRFDWTTKHTVILMILSGKMDLCIEQKPYRISHFTIFHIGKRKQVQINIQRNCTYYVIEYHGDVIYKDAFMQHLYMESRPFHTTFSCVPANPIALELLVQDMYIKWKTGLFQEHLSVKASFYELMYRLFTELTEGEGKPHELDLAESARLYIENHLQEPISMQQVADFLQVSTRHLLRVFKERHGEGPQSYLQRRRIELAIQYLPLKGVSIKEIAAAVGYEDEYYFSRAFKKVMNVSPTAYRLKNPLEESEFTINNENPFHYNKTEPAQVIRIESKEQKRMKQAFLNRVRLPFVAGMLMLLAACNDEQDQSTASKDQAVNTGETVVITDLLNREVEIPAEPKRVVTDFYADMLLTLGIEPIGAYDHVVDAQQVQKLVPNIEKIGVPVNMEKVLSLNPDMIVTLTSEQEELEKFEKIAPTVAVPWLSKDLYGSLLALGKLVQKESVAQEWIEKIEQQAEQARQEIAGIIGEEETVSIFMTYGKSDLRVYGGRELGHIFYRLLGLKPIPYIEEKFKEDPAFETFVADNFSMEMLEDFAGDWIVVMDYKSGGQEDGQMLKELQSSPIWSNLEAVKKNQVLYVEQDPFFSYTPLATEEALQQAVKLIQAYKNR